MIISSGMVFSSGLGIIEEPVPYVAGLFKTTYAGKPTKRYLRIMEQIQKAKSITYHEIEQAMLI